MSLALGLLLALGGCAAPSADVGTPAPALDDVPAGLGSLRQDEITLQLRREGLLVKVTPLHEGVLRLTAPDTYGRLSRIRDASLGALNEQSGTTALQTFLVSFFSYQPDMRFEPEDLHLFSLGLRYRPLAIAPMTAEWGAQRLDQQDTQSAVYAFDGQAGLTSDLVVEYAGARTDEWLRILTALQAERGRVRVRARAGDSLTTGPR